MIMKLKKLTLKSDGWYNCIIPLTGTPCDGNEKADSDSLITFLSDFLNNECYIFSKTKSYV